MESKEGISLLGIIGIGLTTVIGSGIWKDSLLWSNSAGIFSLPALFVGWILMFTVGLAYAECVSMFPQGGGPYSYVGGVFGKKAGSLFGVLYLVAYWCVGAVLAFVSALFTLAAIDFSLLATLNIAILTAVYVVIFMFLAGFTPGKKFGNISFVWALIKIILVVGVTLLVLMNWSPATTFEPPTLAGFQESLNLSIWALLGFEVMLVFAGETSNSEKNVPKGILIALPIFLVLYLLVSLGAAGIVAIGTFPPPPDTGSIGLIMYLSTTIGVPPSAIFAFAAFSAAGTGYAMMAVTNKQIKILSKDGVLPSRLSSEKSGLGASEILGAVFTGIIAVAMVLVMDINTYLSTYSVDIVAGVGVTLVLLSAMLPAGVSALRFRMTMPALVRPFKTPAYLIVFPLSILLSGYLILLNFSNAAINIPILLLFSVAMVLILVYVALRKPQ
ncbi:MAG: APC family permease [Candidatus Thorarchaeota archaeon]